MNFTGFPASPWLLGFSLGIDYQDGIAPFLDMPLLLDLSQPFLLFGPLWTDAAGQGLLPLLIPAHPALLGIPLSFQAFDQDVLTFQARFSNVATIVGLP